MDFSKYRIGFGISGSFCTHEKIKGELRRLVEMGADVTPVFSYQTLQCDTRFGKAKDFVREVTEITGKEGIRTIAQAEPVGPKKLFDIMIIAPCTGNSLAKLAAGITDTPVLMAAKAHMRNGRPLVISVSTNDALGVNFKNIGALMHMKNIYFVPFGQDSWQKKPTSMIAKTELIPETLEAALAGRQLQPVIRA